MVLSLNFNPAVDVHDYEYDDEKEEESHWNKKFNEKGMDDVRTYVHILTPGKDGFLHVYISSS